MKYLLSTNSIALFVSSQARLAVGHTLSNVKLPAVHNARQASIPASAEIASTQYLHRRTQDDTLTFPEGIWTSQGYGYVVAVQDNVTTAAEYLEETKISCIANPRLADFVHIVDFNPNKNVAMVDADSLNLYEFDRSNDFQSGCRNGKTLLATDEGYQRDVLLNYDILVETFSEHYAFFELRGIDWPTLTAAARLDLSTNSTDDELLHSMVKILAPLQDAHVTLDAAELDFHFDGNPAEILLRLQQEYKDSPVENFDEYLQSQMQAYLTAVANYLDDNQLHGNPAELTWGAASNGSIGYLNIFNMWPDNIESFRADVQTAIGDLMDTEAMIIDIRVNGGGLDSVSLGIASHFADEAFTAFSKKAVKGDGYTPAFDVTVDPFDDLDFVYKGDVILLVSESTISAAEIFVLAMSQLPQVTIVGQPTKGALSDMLVKTLPNGWSFTLSNEVYLTPDGELFEMRGIPPDFEAKTELLPVLELENGTDTWMELALKVAHDKIDDDSTASSAAMNHRHGCLGIHNSASLSFVFLLLVFYF